jgi:hypothetical protein
MLPPSPGVQGLDIDTAVGKVKFDADKGGGIQVDNDLLKTKLKAEGFTVSEISISLLHVKAHICSKCGFSSVFSTFTCPKCGTKNG